jgi:alpha-tubulin suppressor-like RCC1 family protein
MVAAGAEHTAAVTEDGELYGWGWGRYGNLGLGDRNDRLIPEKVTSTEVCLFSSIFLLQYTSHFFFISY